MAIYTYCTQEFGFRRWAVDLLSIGCLESAHLRLLDRPRREYEELLCARLLEGFDAVSSLFTSFVDTQISPRLGGIFKCQNPQVFRVQLSGSESISQIHRDRDHGLSPEAVNIWVPLTDTSGANSLWIESAEGAGDFKPVTLRYGEYLQFDGANLAHGSVRNTTEISRVSFDFRVLPQYFTAI